MQEVVYTGMDCVSLVAVASGAKAGMAAALRASSIDIDGTNVCGGDVLLAEKVLGGLIPDNEMVFAHSRPYLTTRALLGRLLLTCAPLVPGAAIAFARSTRVDRAAPALPGAGAPRSPSVGIRPPPLGLRLRSSRSDRAKVPFALSIRGSLPGPRGARPSPACRA